MPEISFKESTRQIRAITSRADEHTKAEDWNAAVDDLRELLQHHCAHHQIVAHEVLDEIHQLHKRSGDYDSAITAKREAIKAGYRSQPHPDADIAECHLLAGQRAEADALFADLRFRTPEDVWLYNAAGFSYAQVSDHDMSARWFRDGIEVALRTGDPDRVVVQLLEGLENAWTNLGSPPEPGLAKLSLPEGGAEWLERWRRDDSGSHVQIQATTGWLETLATPPTQYPSTVKT